MAYYDVTACTVSYIGILQPWIRPRNNTLNFLFLDADNEFTDGWLVAFYRYCYTALELGPFRCDVAADADRS